MVRGETLGPCTCVALRRACASRLPARHTISRSSEMDLLDTPLIETSFLLDLKLDRLGTSPLVSRAVTAVTTFWRGSQPLVGTHACILRCIYCAGRRPYRRYLVTAVTAVAVCALRTRQPFVGKNQAMDQAL